jgi:predicted dehydrogenase
MKRTLDYSKLNSPGIGIGVIGYGFMGKVHSNAYVKIPYTYEKPAAYPRLVAMCGRNEKAALDSARRFGYQYVCTDYEELIGDSDIHIVDNCTPDDMHSMPTRAAVHAGKHVVCEKPLAMTVEDARAMRDEAVSAGVKHMLCHNYRFLPAVRFAKNLIENGEIGEIYQFRAVYLQEVGHNPAEVLENVWYASGTRSGVLLGIGSHIIDLARFLVGEMKTVAGMVTTFNRSRRDSRGREEKVKADEVNGALIEFENGAVGHVESAGVSTGRKNQLGWEINGSKGSIRFDLEDLNHLHVCLDKTGVKDVRGFTCVSVTDFSHPLQSMILPPGHNTGWEYGHVHALHHFIDCVVNDGNLSPYAATFEDGYRVQVIMDAIAKSAGAGNGTALSF